MGGGVNNSGVKSIFVAAVAMEGERRQWGDGRWGQEGATAQRALSPSNGWKWGRASNPDEAGGGGNIIVILLLLSSACFCGEPTEGIIRQEKKIFPAKSGKYPGGGGKKLNSKIWDNCTGHCSTFGSNFFCSPQNSLLFE